MNWFGFAKLIHNIYRKNPPDLEAIQAQGLLAVKIGQTFALRIDFLDAERCNYLTNLYRKTNSIAQEDTMALIAANTADDFLEHFSEFNSTPFASASIGQVHQATLASGEKVVVKLVKEQFTQQFTKDVNSLRRLFSLAIRLYPKLGRVANPLGVLEHIEEYTLNELNLNNEIAGHHQLQTIYENNKHEYDLELLHFPKIYEELSNERVMVSEQLTGLTFDELLERDELEYSQMLDLFHLHGFYMFVIGTFHGDLHPGNAILQDGKIYFIDTGAISTVSDYIRINLFHFMEALAWYDYEKCAYYLNQMSEPDRQLSGERYNIFKEKMIKLYANFEDATVSDVSLTQQMMYTIKLGVDSGMEFERNIFAIIKSLMYMDGMVLRCNPQAILMKDMRGAIKEFKQHLPEITQTR